MAPPRLARSMRTRRVSCEQPPDRRIPRNVFRTVGFEPGFAERARAPAIRVKRVESGGDRLRVRRHDEPVDAVLDELERAAAVAASDHGFPRKKGLERDESVVLAHWAEEHRKR